MKALIVARRELAAYFVSPISYLIATLFLLVQGYSFWLFLSILNSRPVQHGAVMHVDQRAGEVAQRPHAVAAALHAFWNSL